MFTQKAKYRKYKIIFKMKCKRWNKRDVPAEDTKNEVEDEE